MIKYCKQLIVLLHDRPTIERPEKLKPILTTEERKMKVFNSTTFDGTCILYYEKEL